jgi:hypothetical protein
VLENALVAAADRQLLPGRGMPAFGAWTLTGTTSQATRANGTSPEMWRESAKWLNASIELSYPGSSSSSLGSRHDGGGDRALPVF